MCPARRPPCLCLCLPPADVQAERSGVLADQAHRARDTAAEMGGRVSAGVKEAAHQMKASAGACEEGTCLQAGPLPDAWQPNCLLPLRAHCHSTCPTPSNKRLRFAVVLFYLVCRRLCMIWTRMSLVMRERSPRRRQGSRKDPAGASSSQAQL
jgi:hypothetical protein